MARQDRGFQVLAQLCHILGDKTRLRILRDLQDGEKNVSALCKELKVPQPTASRHLAILRMAGLVESRRQGKEIFYCLSDYRSGGPAVRAMIDNNVAVRIGPLVLALAK